MVNGKTTEQALTAAECARRTGLTVKALRVYEREGLLKPKRTLKDWRIYDAVDLARLGEVTALRGLGLKLSDIATLLKGKSSGISSMLELQQEELLLRRKQADDALAALTVLRQRIATGETLTINDIATSIKESQMTAISPESVAWKRYEQMRPRVAIASTLQDILDCAGYYQLDGGPIFHLFGEDSKLMSRLPGQPSVELFKEGPDAWFNAAVSAQFTFARNPSGTVTSLTLHQHGVEHIAPRIGEEDAKHWNERLTKRIANGEPHPDSECLATTLIEHHIKGEPCDDILEPALAHIVAEQREATKQYVAELGALKSLTFLAVTPEGWDAFRAKFEQGEMDMSVFIAASGRISGAWLEPPKTDEFWKKLRDRAL